MLFVRVLHCHRCRVAHSPRNGSMMSPNPAFESKNKRVDTNANCPKAIGIRASENSSDIPKDIKRSVIDLLHSTYDVNNSLKVQQRQ